MYREFIIIKLGRLISDRMDQIKNILSEGLFLLFREFLERNHSCTSPKETHFYQRGKPIFIKFASAYSAIAGGGGACSSSNSLKRDYVQ
jgi:hypothetical protein